MSISNKQVQEFETRYKSYIFKQIIECADVQAKLVANVQDSAKFANINEELPNIGITLNNKMVEISQEFREAGISMFSSKIENYGTYGLDLVGESFIGEALIEDMFDRVLEGNYVLEEYDNTMGEMLNKRTTQSQALQKAGPIRKMFLKLRGLVIPTKRIDYRFAKEETEKLDCFLSKYTAIDQELWKFSLRDNVVESLVKYIKQKGYSRGTIQGLLDECVISDLQKLGLSDLVPELKQQLEELFEEQKNEKPGELTPELKRKMQEIQQQIAENHIVCTGEMETEEKAIEEQG